MHGYLIPSKIASISSSTSYAVTRIEYAVSLETSSLHARQMKFAIKTIAPELHEHSNCLWQKNPMIMSYSQRVYELSLENITIRRTVSTWWIRMEHSVVNTLQVKGQCINVRAWLWCPKVKIAGGVKWCFGVSTEFILSQKPISFLGLPTESVLSQKG